jgi:tetratricopeptide (TPR) repeat protein
MGSIPIGGSGDFKEEFAEPIPEYLRPGYRALMAGDGFTAIELWEALYRRYPAAEICGHLSRAHYYPIYFLAQQNDPVKRAGHLCQMKLWAERALELNPNSSTGHAMLAGAIGLQAMLSGSQKQIIITAWQIRQHAERAILIDSNWLGHYVMGGWHRELAGVNRGIRTLIQIFQWKLPQGSYEESIRHYQEILRQYPDNNTIYAELGYTYEAMGELATAHEMLKHCITMPLFKHPIASYLTQTATERVAKLARKMGK